MAGDWIKMRRELLTSPKVVRIMSACDADRFRTIGGLFAAWCLFDEQTEDGTLEGYTPTVFDEIVGFPGLCCAMAEVGWIRISPQSLIAVGFTEHNGQTAKRRAQESVRKMSARDADRKADKKRPREEKRREEKNIKTKQQHPYFEDEEFTQVLEAFRRQSSASHHWIVGDDVVQAWLYELTKFPLDDAKSILRFSTAAGAKKPILNGDHKPKSASRKSRILDIIPKD